MLWKWLYNIKCVSLRTYLIRIIYGVQQHKGCTVVIKYQSPKSSIIEVKGDWVIINTNSLIPCKLHMTFIMLSGKIFENYLVYEHISTNFTCHVLWCFTAMGDTVKTRDRTCMLTTYGWLRAWLNKVALM